jgi:hypothetical protein
MIRALKDQSPATGIETFWRIECPSEAADD